MQRVTDCYERAIAALDLKHTELAMQIVVSGLAATPDCPELLSLAAQIQYFRKEYSSACEFARQALGKNANYYDAYFWLAHSLLQRPVGEYDRAELSSAVERVLELQPENASSHQLVGLLAWHSGNLAAAVRSYRRALELDPENDHTLQSLGSLARYRGRWEESRELLEKLLTLHPTAGDGLRELAWWHLNQKDPQAALQCGLAARELLPNDFQTAEVIARTAFELRDYDLALQSIRDLQNLAPDNTYVWSFAAEVLVACGRYREAYVSANRAIALDSANWSAHTSLVTAMHSLVVNHGGPLVANPQTSMTTKHRAITPKLAARRICRQSCTTKPSP